MSLGASGPSLYVVRGQHLQERRKSGSLERCEVSVDRGLGAWGEADELQWQGTGC